MMAEEAPSVHNKAAASGRPARRVLSRQTWIVVGVTTFAMLLVCTSLVLLQRHFNLTSYFHQSGSVAAAVAAAVGSRRQDISLKRIEQLAREIREPRNTTLRSSETSQPRRVRGKSLARGGGTKERRAKGTVKGEQRNIAGDRPDATTAVFDAGRELKALQHAFAERRERAAKKRRRSKSGSLDATTSTKVTSAGSTRLELPGGGVTSDQTSRGTLETISSTSAQFELPQVATGSIVPVDTTTSGSASQPQITRPARAVRMLKKRRKWRLRVTVPSSTPHSTAISSPEGLRGLKVKLHQNVTEKPSSEENARVLGQSAEHSSSRTPGRSDKTTSGKSFTEARKTVFTAPAVSNSGTGVKTGTGGTKKVTETAVSETSEHREKYTFDKTKHASEKGNGTLEDTTPKRSMPSRYSTPYNITGSGHTTSQREAAVTVNDSISVSATQSSRSKEPRNSSMSPSSEPSLNRSTRNARTSTSSAAGAKLVNAETGSGKATFSARSLSPAPSTERISNATLRSPPGSSSSMESGSTGNVAQSFSSKPNETLADSNRSIDAVLEGHIKTVEDIINKILEKTGDDKGGLGFENSTRGREGSDTAHATAGDANTHGRFQNKSSEASETTSLQPSVKTTGVPSSEKLRGSSISMASESKANIKLTTGSEINVSSTGTPTRTGTTSPVKHPLTTSTKINVTNAGTPTQTATTSPVTHPSATPLTTKDAAMHTSGEKRSTSELTKRDKHSVPPSANETSATEYPTERLSTERVPRRLATETERPISTSAETLRPEKTTEEFVPEVKPLLTSTAGPPDEIVPEPEGTHEPPNMETTEQKTTTTSTTFAYYTGKEEWIPEGDVGRLVGKGDHARRQKKTLLKAEAPPSHVLLSMAQASLPPNPERPAQRHDDSQSPQVEQPGSEKRKNDISGGEDSAALKADVNSGLKSLYSSLKDAIEEEKKHRPKENSEEMQDYGIGEHASENDPSRSLEENFTAPDNADRPVKGNFLASKVTVHSAETSLLHDAWYPQEHNLSGNSIASKEVTPRFLSIEQNVNAYGLPGSTVETAVPVPGREAPTDKASYSRGPDADEHITGPPSVTGTIGLVLTSSRSQYNYISKEPVEESSIHMNNATNDRSQRLASTQSTVLRLTGPTESKEAVVQLKDGASTFLNPTTSGRGSLSTTEGNKSNDRVRWTVFEDERRQFTSTEPQPSTGMSTEAEKARPFLYGGNDTGMVTHSWIRSETSRQSEGSALPGQLEEFETTRRETRLEGNKDKRSSSTSTEYEPSTDNAGPFLGGGNAMGMVTPSWISSEKSHQSVGSALPGQLEEYETTRRETRLEGNYNEPGRATDGEVPVFRRPGVVCVYNRSHSGWKSEGASYSISSIPYEYCSSVLYCCLSLDNELDIEGFGNQSDFRYLANMKKANPGMHAFVVIGGSESPTASFRHLVSNSVHQDIFLQLTVHWMRTKEFDGAYLYWPQMEDQDGNDATDAYRYLATSFSKLNLKLGIILPSSSQYFEKEASLEALTKDLDGSFDAVLLSPPGIDEASHGSALAYHTKGLSNAFGRYPTSLPGSVPVCPMIPFWGRTFKMQAVFQETGLALKPAGYGAPRAVSQEPGKLAFFEFCRDLNSSASVFSTPEQVIIGNEYMTLLTPASLERYLTSMVDSKAWRCFGSWGPEWDDFAGRCGLARYPLLRTLYEFQVNRSIKMTAELAASDAGES